MLKRISLLFLMVFSFSAVFAQEEAPLAPGLYAKLAVEEGDLIFKLYEKEAPLSVMSFVGLTEGTILPNEDGSPYYSNLSFYRVIKDYSLFSGDPENTGEGHTGIAFPQSEVPSLDLGNRGVLALQGYPGISQAGNFFITLMGDAFLNQVYTPFGKIVSGDDLLDNIKRNDVVKSIEILRVGSDAESYRVDEETLQAALNEAKKKELETIKVTQPDLAKVLETFPSYEKTETGIFYYIRYEGYGEKPRAGNRVSVHYTGKLLNGQVFDSSVQRGTPFSLEIGKDAVISGWVETLMDMKPGENRVVVIPPELAYGSRGAGGSIPPDAWLIFEIQLLGVE